MIAKWVLHHKYLILAVFAILVAVSVLLAPTVSVNYNLADYLPPDAPSTVALDVMGEEFDQGTPNLRVYLPDVSLPEALAAKATLAALPGIDAVNWLDDVVDVKQPLEMADADTVEAFWLDGGALYTVTAASGNAVATVQSIRDALGGSVAVAGTLADMAAQQLTLEAEITRILLFLLPIVLVILIVSTRSWFEPVLFAVTIGVSILLNLGSNALFGEVSYVTQNVAPILQLAVSMDYAVFLLRSFAGFRDEGHDNVTAMRMAMIKSATAVLASALTTIVGFLVLCLMRFGLGSDLGLVLAKGITFSLLSVMLLLPVLGVLCAGLLDKTRHRSFLPSFAKFGRAVGHIRVPMLLLALLLCVPTYLAQQKNAFTYGSAGAAEGTQIGEDSSLIDAKFGRSVQMALLVPRGQWGGETALQARLETLPDVTAVISYVSAVGVQVPADFVPEDSRSQLLSAHYSRFIVAANVPDEGAEAFALAATVRSIASEYYGEEYYLCGINVNNLDMRDTITADEVLVNGLAIAAIAMILLLSFRSLSLPLLLVLTIELSIWINLSIPFFTGLPMAYIGYLVVSTVQLGATVDYAILYTEHYMTHRRANPKREAAVEALTETAPTILTPAAILTAAGLVLGLVSSNTLVSELGIVLGRGAALSATLVLLLLPALLMLFDGVIGRTTLRAGFAKTPKPLRSRVAAADVPDARLRDKRYTVKRE